jgi:hypothetical protein
VKMSRHTAAAVGGALAVIVSACRGRIERNYGFELPVAKLASGGNLSLIVQGRPVFYDSAGTSIVRTGSPYRIALWVWGRGSEDLDLSTVRFTGVESGRSTSPSFPPLGLLDSSRFSPAEAKLPYEDHIVLIHLEPRPGSVARAETVRLVLRRRYVEERDPLLPLLQRVTRRQE